MNNFSLSASPPPLFLRKHWGYMIAAFAFLLFTLFDYTALAQTTPEEILEDFYEATSGDGWDDNTGWGGGTIPATANLDDLYGVSVNSNGEITELGLDSNQLTGTIPSKLGSLTNLQRLHLSRNQLTGTIPSKLGSLTNLRELHLSSNRLTGTIPSELEDLTNLQRLQLDYNQLTGTIPSELGDLTALGYLFLEGNQLTGTIPSELKSLTNVVHLHLSHNQLTGTIPSELGELTTNNLFHLDLDYNQLTGTIPSELGELTSLKKLDLDYNQLTGTIPSELGELTNLEQLYLNNNQQLTGELPLSLTNLSSLTIFDISDTCLSTPTDNGFQTWLEEDGRTFLREQEGCTPLSPSQLLDDTDTQLPDDTDTQLLDDTDTQLPDESPPFGSPQSNGGGGCAIASEKLKGNMSKGTLLNLFLVVSVPFLAAPRKKR